MVLDNHINPKYTVSNTTLIPRLLARSFQHFHSIPIQYSPDHLRLPPNLFIRGLIHPRDEACRSVFRRVMKPSARGQGAGKRRGWSLRWQAREREKEAAAKRIGRGKTEGRLSLSARLHFCETHSSLRHKGRKLG